jgi:hypothetical protein
MKVQLHKNARHHTKILTNNKRVKVQQHVQLQEKIQQKVT